MEEAKIISAGEPGKDIGSLFEQDAMAKGLWEETGTKLMDAWADAAVGLRRSRSKKGAVTKAMKASNNTSQHYKTLTTKELQDLIKKRLKELDFKPIGPETKFAREQVDLYMEELADRSSFCMDEGDSVASRG